LKDTHAHAHYAYDNSVALSGIGDVQKAIGSAKLLYAGVG